MAAHDADNAADAAGSTSRCWRCDADLSRLTGAARFCYQCGSPLDLDQQKTSRLSLPVLPHFNDLFSTMIVRGYAHAIFRLGTHYEVRRNGHEAARCYGKASRLGSEPARARLAHLPAETVADAADVNEYSPGLPPEQWVDAWAEFHRPANPEASRHGPCNSQTS